jgi:hypothetical protein
MSGNAVRASFFAMQLKRMADNIGADIEEVTEKAVIDLHAVIRDDTPKDTGQARSGWQLEGSGQRWTIFNNVEYIEALENGHSRQAPYGMVDVNLHTFEARFKVYADNKRGLVPK